jgi:LysM repeat protein
LGSNTPPCERARYYTVQPGDTLYLIARDLGVSLDALLRLNPTLDPYNLRVGAMICVPLEAGVPTGNVPPCDSGLYWVISPGETLFSIAFATGTPLETLLALNPSVDPLNLLPGDSVCLPPRP